jgi:NAD(P)-dependent dehydrogenase (short-subunit alcohol dehydrogenase family)
MFTVINQRRTAMTQNSVRKIAIVTGGSRGLGRNTVLNLARRGVDSILTYNSSRAEAEKVVTLVAEAGAKAIALKLDTGDAHGFDPFVDAVKQALADLGAERASTTSSTMPEPRTTTASRRRRKMNWTCFTVCTSRAFSS